MYHQLKTLTRKVFSVTHPCGTKWEQNSGCFCWLFEVSANEADFAASRDKDDCIQVCLFSNVVTATPQQGKPVQRNTANTDVSCLSSLVSLGVAQPVYDTDDSQAPHKQQWWCTVQQGFQLGLNLRSRLMITGCKFAELVAVTEEVTAWPHKGNCKMRGLKLWMLFLIYNILFQNDRHVTDRCHKYKSFNLPCLFWQSWYGFLFSLVDKNTVCPTHLK